MKLCSRNWNFCRSSSSDWFVMSSLSILRRVFCFPSFKIWFTFCSTLLLSVSVLIPQEEAKTDQVPGRSEHVTGILHDDRFKIENLSFLRRHVPSGSGEFFDVIFDIVNKDLDSLDLKLFIIGFHEKSGVDLEYRKRIPYPTWRKHDLEKDIHRITYLDSIPSINPADVEPFETEVNKVASALSIKKVYPAFLAYIKYVEQNPESGIAFKLYGIANEPIGGATKNIKYCKITEGPLKTSVSGTLYTKYHPDADRAPDFFNHIGILVYDTKLQKVVHREFYKFRLSRLY